MLLTGNLVLHRDKFQDEQPCKKHPLFKEENIGLNCCHKGFEKCRSSNYLSLFRPEAKTRFFPPLTC